MAKILITGGTGLVGTQLIKLLEDKGHKIAVLSRNPKAKNHYKWNIQDKYIDEKAFENIDYIIHLAGAGIVDRRWTDQRKEILLSSRVEATNLLFNKVQELNIPIKKFISASGIGFYGAITKEKTFTEKDAPHNDFIAKICVEWEAAAKQFSKLNIPQTILRTGVVLAKKNSALQKINTPLLLASIGSGKQYFSFIHLTDLCNLFSKAIEDKGFKGIYNAVAPENLSMDSFTKCLGKVVKKPVSVLNVPSFALKLVMGEMANVLLEGSRISAEKTANVYKFKHPTLEECLNSIYK